MGRAPCCSKVGLHRGPWAAREDKSLINYIQAHGEGNWRSLPKKAGLLRCGKSCRLRWMNYLRPGIKRGNITPDEDDLIIRLHSFLGNRWSLIAGRLPGRTDNELKNYWNTHLSKRLVSQGTHDPNTHKRLPAEQVQVQPVRKREGNPENKRQKSKSEEPERPKIHLPKPGRIRSFYLPAAGNDSFNTLTPVWSSRRGEGGLGAEVTQVANTWSDDAGPELDRMIEFLGSYDDRDGAIRGSDFPSSDASLEKLYEEYLELLKTNN